MAAQREIPNESKLEIKNWVCENIRITHSQAQYQEQSLHTAHSDADVVRLHFGIRGNYSVNYKQIGKAFDLVGGHHNLFYSREFDMEFQNRTLQIETFGIQFGRDMFLKLTENATEELKNFAGRILNRQPVIFSDSWAAIDLPIQRVIQQIIQNEYPDGLQQLFLFSKSIELLVLATTANTAARTDAKLIITNNADKAKIIAARDLINDQLHTPPNLSQISKTVGLNEYKLKHGFKEIFKTTVFNYLTDQRLHLALNHLTSSQKTVAEIAFEMGYSSPQHFNNAFRKKFGITPNSVRKNP